jgi:hypothetical protein
MRRVYEKVVDRLERLGLVRKRLFETGPLRHSEVYFLNRTSWLALAVEACSWRVTGTNLGTVAPLQSLLVIVIRPSREALSAVQRRLPVREDCELGIAARWSRHQREESLASVGPSTSSITSARLSPARSKSWTMAMLG